MHARRNTITIAVLWVILIVIGILWYNKETHRVKLMKEKNKELTNQLDGSLEVIQALNSVESEYQRIQQSWDQAPKKIIAADEPLFTLYYLNWLINSCNVTLDFDFILDYINSEGKIITFRFTLTGEGQYHDIYRLIRLLTENPLLYQIESLLIKDKRDSPNLLEFKMQIRGFSLIQQLETSSEQDFSFATLKPISESSQFYDAFKPLQRKIESAPTVNRFNKEKPKAIRKPISEGLVNIEQTTLQAVANGKVYLKDKNGKLLTFKVGDKVHMGTLRNINKEKSEVEFVVDKGGVQEKVVLGLGYKK